MQNEQKQEAITAWVKVYTIAKQINLAQTLQALSQLAPELGLPEGLEFWEQLAQHIQSGGSFEQAQQMTKRHYKTADISTKK